MSTTVKPGAPAPVVAASSTAALGKERSSAGLVAKRFLRHRMAVAGLVIVALLILAAALAPWLAPHDPNRIFDSFEAPPSADHLLGTDPDAHGHPGAVDQPGTTGAGWTW